MTLARGRPWPERLDLPALAAMFVLLAAGTWGAWPDVLVDFGRELYVAWRISLGDVLYRDVASFYGPLSPYVNGALFRLLGASLRTLALANLVLLAAATALLRALLLQAGTSRGAASAAAAVFLAVFGFGHLVANGSFNFVCPYAHEATHGFVLAAAALLCALRAADVPEEPRAWAAAAGGLCGLAFLTKPEPFVAAAGACTLALLLSSGGRRRAGTAVFATALALPPLAAFALLSMAMPADEAWRGTLGSWAFLGNAQLTRMSYFGWSAGLDRPREHLAALALASAWQTAALVAVGTVAWALRGRRGIAPWVASGCAAVLAAVLAMHWGSRAWLRAARPLPLWAAALLAAGAAALWRATDGEGRRVARARTALAAFALLMLARTIFNARFFHYGFVLSAAATVIVVAALLDWIPRALDARGAAGVVVWAAGAVGVSFLAAWSVRDTREFVASKTVRVGGGADAFLADARGRFVNAAVENIPRASRDGSLVVLPEGVMVNYLLRRPSSIPYLTMLPSDEAQFGEDELLGSLQRRPPELVALVHRTADEFGAPLFGRDYSARTMEWIEAHYATAFTIGDPPLQPGSAFGVRLLARRGGGPGP